MMTNFNETDILFQPGGMDEDLFSLKAKSPELSVKKEKLSKFLSKGRKTIGGDGISPPPHPPPTDF